jgi:protein-S-isoprenylcysteine O-methyltransferase Ste14
MAGYIITAILFLFPGIAANPGEKENLTEQLVFNIGMTTYIFIGMYHAERDLAKLFGQQYDLYRLREPKLIPFSKSGKKMG